MCIRAVMEHFVPCVRSIADFGQVSSETVSSTMENIYTLYIDMYRAPRVARYGPAEHGRKAPSRGGLSPRCCSHYTFLSLTACRICFSRDAREEAAQSSLSRAALRYISTAAL